MFANQNFSVSFATYLNLLVILVAFPVPSLIWNDASMLENLTPTLLTMALIGTVLMLWGLFGLSWLAVFLEKTGLAGIGITRPRFIDLAWAASFFLASVVVVIVMEWLLSVFGLVVPGEVGLLVPTNWTGKLLWVLVSFTAGFCEETVFRGYLMTRIRLLGKFNSWAVPLLVSAVAFGACHTYEGIAGTIMIATYGAMLSLLYIYTRRLWPCIIAHAMFDLMALFAPSWS